MFVSVWSCWKDNANLAFLIIDLYDLKLSFPRRQFLIFSSAPCRCILHDVYLLGMHGL
uniref:Uncharacterized protein MANES_06G091000 n=1 Tax=Rhizophora mucronata TaxID=61149 RepID=A0A2P2MQM1_RHIMU